MRENTNPKKLRIWTLFTQCIYHYFLKKANQKCTKVPTISIMIKYLQFVNNYHWRRLCTYIINEQILQSFLTFWPLLHKTAIANFQFQS